MSTAKKTNFCLKNIGGRWHCHDTGNAATNDAAGRAMCVMKNGKAYRNSTMGGDHIDIPKGQCPGSPNRSTRPTTSTQKPRSNRKSTPKRAELDPFMFPSRPDRTVPVAILNHQPSACNSNTSRVVTQDHFDIFLRGMRDTVEGFECLRDILVKRDHNDKERGPDGILFTEYLINNLRRYRVPEDQINEMSKERDATTKLVESLQYYNIIELFMVVPRTDTRFWDNIHLSYRISKGANKDIIDTFNLRKRLYEQGLNVLHTQVETITDTLYKMDRNWVEEGANSYKPDIDALLGNTPSTVKDFICASADRLRGEGEGKIPDGYKKYVDVFISGEDPDKIDHVRQLEAEYKETEFLAAIAKSKYDAAIQSRGR